MNMNGHRGSSHFLMGKIKPDGDFLSKPGWSTGRIIAYYAKEYGLGNIIHTRGPENRFGRDSMPIAAAVNALDAPEAVLSSFTGYCIEYNIPILYPFDMEWGAAIIISNNSTPLNVAKKTKTGNYKDDIMAYVGRYVSFWSHQTPASLLLNNNPVFSNTLMLQASLHVLAAIASGKRIKLFPDMYYCLCNPGKRI